MLISGHLPYETVTVLSPDVSVCTVIRDPVERTLSHYSHVNNELAKVAPGQHVSIEDFVGADQWRPLWENYQARYLVHEIGLSGAWSKFSPVEQMAGRNLSTADSQFPLQSQFDSTRLTMPGPDLLNAASTRLEKINLVGVTEDLLSLSSTRRCLLAQGCARLDRAVPGDRSTTAAPGPTDHAPCRDRAGDDGRRRALRPGPRPQHQDRNPLTGRVPISPARACARW